MKSSAPTTESSISRWVGRIYGVIALLAFCGGGMVALWIRAFHWQSRMDATVHTYMPKVSLHGALMMFFFAVPVLTAGLGNLVLPHRLRVNHLGHGGLNLAGLLLFMSGAVIGLRVLLTHPVVVGWTLYFPREGGLYSGVAFESLLAVSLMAISGSLHAMVFLLAIDRRPELYDVPISHDPLLAAIHATSILHLMSLPIVALAFLWWSFERLELVQMAYLYLSHPSVYLLIAPGLGYLAAIFNDSEPLSIRSRRGISGSFYWVMALGMGKVMLFLWEVYHPGDPRIHRMLANGLMVAAALPVLAVVVILVSQWRKRSPRPVALADGYARLSLFLILLGAVTGVWLGAAPQGEQLIGTYFLVAHFHTILLGIIVMATAAAVHHWAPVISSRGFCESTGRRGLLMTALGILVTLMAQFAVGLGGMYRRAPVYPEALQGLNQVVSVGTWISAVGIFIAIWAWVRGDAATLKRNPSV